MNVENKDRFPHHYQINKLGGFDTEKGKEYFEKYEKELNAEYDFYWDESGGCGKGGQSGLAVGCGGPSLRIREVVVGGDAG